jgi:guanylate kinase
MSRRGKLIVISAPSGSGKTTIAQEILRRHPEFDFSVSATTRKRRENEQEGKDYFFVTREEFERKIKRGELAEHEIIYGDYYGSLKSVVEKALAEGRVLVFDIDVKGARTLKEKYPDDTVLIFVQPPSLGTLRERLMKRKTEDQQAIMKRFERVPMELELGKTFDHIVVNDDLEDAIREVDAIVNSTLEGW